MKYEKWVKKLEAEQEAGLKKGVPRGRIHLDAFVEKIIQQHGRTPLTPRVVPQDSLDQARRSVAGRRRKPPQKRPKTDSRGLEESIRLAMSQRRKGHRDIFGRSGG